MMQITREDLKRYKKVQNIHTCRMNQRNYRQTRYGLYRWKASGLDIQKYLHIADNENKYFGGKGK